MSINVKDLADAIVEKCGVTKVKAIEGAEALFASIITQVTAGNKVFVSDFGEFSIINKPARKARNPKTGETVQVEAYKKMQFKPAKAFRKIK
jgi:DNA-binding protein HU-beta